MQYEETGYEIPPQNIDMEDAARTNRELIRITRIESRWFLFSVILSLIAIVLGILVITKRLFS